MYLCDPSPDIGWHRAGAQSVGAAQLSMPYQCSAKTHPRKEVVSSYNACVGWGGVGHVCYFCVFL